MRVCVCVHGGDDHSKSACHSWVSATASSLSSSASVYLWTKGCFETNDLAPVSQSRRTGDEKRKRSEMEKGEMMEAFRQTVKEAEE